MQNVVTVSDKSKHPRNKNNRNYNIVIEKTKQLKWSGADNNVAKYLTGNKNEVFIGYCTR